MTQTQTTRNLMQESLIFEEGSYWTSDGVATQNYQYLMLRLKVGERFQLYTINRSNNWVKHYIECFSYEKRNIGTGYEYKTNEKRISKIYDNTEDFEKAINRIQAKLDKIGEYKR